MERDEPESAPPISLPPPPPVLRAPTGAAATTARPVSVTLIAVYFLLAAAGEIGAFSPSASGRFGPAAGSWLMIANQVDSGVFLVLKLAAGVGLLRLAPWAPGLAMVTLIARFIIGNAFGALWILYLPQAMATAIHAPPNLMRAMLIVGVAISAITMGVLYSLMIYALTRPAVKEAFRQAAQG